MWDLWYLVPVIVLGVAIVASYIWLANAQTAGEYWGRLLRDEKLARTYWKLSGLVAAPLSWGWMLYYWVFSADSAVTVCGYSRDYFRDSILFPVLVVFLVSALCWAPLTVWCYRLESPSLRILVRLTLWVTAATSVILFVAAAGTRVAGDATRAWSSTETLLSVAGGIVAFHHVIWDACVWDATWDFAERVATRD